MCYVWEKTTKKISWSFESKDIASTFLFMVFCGYLISFRIEKIEALLAKILQIDGILSGNSFI